MEVWPYSPYQMQHQYLSGRASHAYWPQAYASAAGKRSEHSLLVNHETYQPIVEYLESYPPSTSLAELRVTGPTPGYLSSFQACKLDRIQRLYFDGVDIDWMLTNIAPEVLSAFKGVWRIYLSGRCSQPACIDAILTRFTELRYAHVDNVSCAGQVCPPPQFMAQPAGLRLGASFRWDFNPHWRSLTVLALDAVHLGVLKHAGAFVQAVGPQLVTFSLECVWDSYAVGLWRQIGRINVRHMPKLENLHLRIPESAPYKHGWAYRVLGQHDDNVPMGPIPASLREITISLHLTNSRHLADVCRDWSGTHEYWSAPQITIKFIHVAGLPFDDAEQAIRASFGRLYFPRQLEVINPSP